MGYRKYDPVGSRRKSAFQKYVRRGMVTEAVATAQAAIDAGQGKSIARRLMVICAEDVDWRWLPWVVAALKPVMAGRVEGQVTLHQREGEVPLLDVVAAMAAAPKNKEAYWLYAQVWGDRGAKLLGGKNVTSQMLHEAVDGRQYVRAAAIAMIAADEGVLTGTGGWSRGMSLGRYPAAAEIVRAGLYVTAMGGAGEPTCAAVMAAIDDDLYPLSDPYVPWYEVEPEPPLPWWGVDGHTDVGRRAIAAVAKRTGISRKLLDYLWFDMESVRTSPAADTLRSLEWREAAMAIDGAECGWGTEDEGRKLWETVGPELQRQTEWVLKSLPNGGQ